MSRRRKLALIVGAALVVLGGAFLWALPEIVRRVALDQIPKRTGRAITIEAVGLNLFTGHLALRNVRLANRDGPDPFLAFERLDVRLALPALLRHEIRLVEIVLVGPAIRIVRTGPAEFNFSDLLVPSAAPATPSRWIVTIERLTVARGRVEVDDHAVVPPAQWLIQELAVDAGRLTTRTGAPAGRLAVRVTINGALLTLTADPLRLDPALANARLTLDGYEIGWLESYVYAPLGMHYRPRGRLTLALAAQIDSDAQEVRTARLSGMIGVHEEASVPVGGGNPFLSASQVAVEIKDADLLARTLTVGSARIEGLQFRARRDAHGVVDVLEVFELTPPPPPTGPPGTPPPAAGRPPSPPDRRRIFPIIQALAQGFEQIRVERIVLAPSRATFVDGAVTPTTTLALTNLQARLDDFTWPVAGPASLALSTGLPGGGTLEVKGPVTAKPLDAELAIAMRNAPVEPYQAYIPVPARLSGRFGGDSRNRVALRDGKLVVSSRGNSWGQNVEIREPGASPPTIHVDRMELTGIDFEWPTRGAVARAVFRRPRIEIERGADGAINVRRLFSPPEPERPPSTPAPAPPGSAEPPGVLETMRLDFREVRVADGFIRFLDRTTKPAFSEDLSRLELTVTDLGNRPGRRARLTLQSLVGGDAGLDIRGELGALGAPIFVDLVGELRRFELPSVDPYSASAIGWVIKRGELQYKVHFKLDRDQLEAENDVLVGRLQVAPASGGDEVKRRIGLPLGLIVALVKDQQGNIQVNVPVTGSVTDPEFHLRDAVWAAVKKILVNIVAAPFKAIGRLFAGGETVEEPKVDPVTFAAGSSVLSPAMEDHLLRVADFLRRAPFVNLTMGAVPGPGDLEALRGEAVGSRLRAFQKERGLDDAAVLPAYFAERLPEVPPPASAEAQLALLRAREPVPEPLLAELGQRRHDAIRERLLAVEGIPAGRLAATEATPGSTTPATSADGEGRIEFRVTAGE
jgi:hypothetical protein